MNISTIFGIAIAIWVLWSGVFAHAQNPKLFLDSHAIILVLGGTLAAALIAFPYRKLLGLIDFILMGAIFKSKIKSCDLGMQVILTSDLFKSNQIKDRYYSLGYHPFLVESIVLLLNEKFSSEELVEILDSRIELVKNDYLSDAKLLNALAKFPPAFGLLGASTGMISMMTKLGGGGAETIGPSMAIALVATFWGIAVANFILLPLCDHATKIAHDEVKNRKMIADCIIAINNQRSLSFIAEKLISHISFAERKKFKQDIRTFLEERNRLFHKNSNSNSQKNPLVQTKHSAA